MYHTSVQHYRCPVHHSPLELDAAETSDGLVESGFLTSREGRRYKIQHGIPNLTFPDELSDIEAQTQEEYDRVADGIYDAALEWQFAALHEDETTVRRNMVDLLNLRPGDRVLEVGCGTGRDSAILAQRLGESGALFMQDLSPNMVHSCRKAMARYDQEMSFQCPLHYSISNATYLPFPDDFFDAVFHFGGFNQFGDLEKAANEFTRITKQGGRIIYGDESVGPWLRGSEFEGIVCANNPLFRHDLPIHTVPDCARDVSVRWIMANCFYVISFIKGDGLPALNLDLPHAGWRGGTMRSRYFGVLEGVTVETKEMVRDAAAESGLSVHAWLDRLIRDEAEKILGIKGRKG